MVELDLERASGGCRPVSLEAGLRPAERSDVARIAALMNMAYRGGGEIRSWNSEALFMRGDRTTVEAVAQELSAPGGVVLLIWPAPDGGIIGCVRLQPDVDGAWHLGSLAVDPAIQNAGHGRRLLEKAEVWAATRGARTIRMSVIQVRESLIAWYLRRGYQLTGLCEPFPYEDDRFGTPTRPDLHFVILEKEVHALPRSDEFTAVERAAGREGVPADQVFGPSEEVDRSAVRTPEEIPRTSPIMEHPRPPNGDA